LNLVGGAVTNPLIADSLLGADSAFRRAMFRHGLLFRATFIPRFSDNVLDGPVPASQQVYIGERPTVILGSNPVFAADLRQLGLHHAQLTVGFGWRRTNWAPAGPDSFGLTTLYFYKAWGDRRAEIKIGYLTNDLEFVGLQVGGSTSTGSQGVFAVLPNEVGQSFFPLGAPASNLRLRIGHFSYFKTSVQRSLDPAGAQSTVDHNPSGFLFRPNGTKLLWIGEGGYQRPAAAGQPQAWLRVGYMHNTTPYRNKETGRLEAGNYCAYALMDYQVRMPEPSAPARGLFLGGTAMTVPSEFNAYDRYYEVRMYRRGTFVSRPTDVFAFIASYRNHSPFVTGPLVAKGQSVWDNSEALTGTYTAHASRGVYVGLSLGYIRGAAITPRVRDALTFTVNSNVYF